jgi:outer membrane lipoprotein LolB
MYKNFTTNLVVALFCLIMASCATVKQQITTTEKIKSEPVAWAAEQKKRQQINNWEIRGRLGVQTQTTGGSMDIIWKNADQDYSIRLIAPLGSGSYRVQGNSDYAEIRYPDGRTDMVSNIDHVFNSILDINLPASAVKDWIRGLPSKALSVEQISWNKQGLLTKIKQSGWNVEMTKYTGDIILMPHAIYLSRDDDSELDVRLILRQWLVD